jgi:hypothetical protein
MQGVSLRRIQQGRPGAGIAVARLHYDADSSLTPERIAKLKSSYTSEARWRREMEIEYEALEGTLLYPDFNRKRNVCKQFDVSDRWRWTIYMACDPHMRTPHAFVWKAFNASGEWVQCGELWPVDGVRYRTSEYAEAIEWLESDSDNKIECFRWAQGRKLKVFKRVMDTHGSAANSDQENEDYFEAYRSQGHRLRKNKRSDFSLNFEPAIKGHNALEKAVDKINGDFSGRVEGESREPGPPRGHVFEGCEETILEYENVRFPAPKPKTSFDEQKEGVASKESEERVITYRKHCIDADHYIHTSKPRFVLPPRGRVPDDDKYVVQAHH